MASTADLSDELGESLQYCDIPFRDYGGHRSFGGPVSTVRCFEDNALARSVLSTPGHGGVLVVDGGGSTRFALLGDQMAQLAIDNGWAGVVIFGAVRDTRMLALMNLGVKALQSHPRRSNKTGAGDQNVAVSFGGAIFRPGDRVFGDEDGVVVQAAG